MSYDDPNYFSSDGYIEDDDPPMSESPDGRDSEDRDDFDDDYTPPARYRDEPDWNDPELIRRRNAQIEEMHLENAIWPWLDDDSMSDHNCEGY